MTRPSGQAGPFAALLERAGARAILFPTLGIAALEDLAPTLARIDRLEEFDWAIFISPTAVERAFNLIRSRRGAQGWPARVRAAAIGRGSRKALEQQGIASVLAPGARADSEALLALPELAELSGRRVLIFRGEGGRELLADSLAARGARVELAECYRRVRPAGDARALLSAWARGEVDAVTVTSGEALANLFEMLGKLGQRWLKDTPLFVAHVRIAEEARRLGVSRPVVAGAGDEEMLAALVAYFGAAK